MKRVIRFLESVSVALATDNLTPAPSSAPRERLSAFLESVSAAEATDILTPEPLAGTARLSKGLRSACEALRRDGEAVCVLCSVL